MKERNRIATSNLERKRLKAGFGDWEANERDRVVSRYFSFLGSSVPFVSHTPCDYWKTCKCSLREMCIKGATSCCPSSAIDLILCALFMPPMHSYSSYREDMLTHPVAFRFELRRKVSNMSFVSDGMRGKMRSGCMTVATDRRRRIATRKKP